MAAPICSPSFTRDDGLASPLKHLLSKGGNRVEQEHADSDYRMMTVDFSVDPVGQIDVDAAATQRNRRVEELND